ncbi:MAG: GWxTD domain-containing protein [Gemmatimonadota bacterium]
MHTRFPDQSSHSLRQILAGSLLAVSCLVLAVPLQAQEPAERDAIEIFRDSLEAITDTSRLIAMERRMVEEVKADRNNALRHIRIGFVNLRLGDIGIQDRYEDAASEFNWATELQPRWPYGWYGMGFAEIGVGEPQIALIAGLQNMFGKDHMTKGALAFARAAEVDPTFVRGLAELANTALNQKINIKLDLAREALRLASATSAGDNPELLLWRGRVEREVGDADTAVSAFKGYLASPGINRSLGLIELARAQFVAGSDEGAQAYFEGAALDDSIGVPEYRKDLSYIAPDSTMKAFDEARGAARADLLRGFWTERDRSDLRRDNERLREHYRRIQYAKRNFALVSTRRHYDISERYRSNSKDFDDRGVIYIRHGEPSDRATLGIPNIELNETWKYARADGDLVFHFLAKEDVQDYKLVASIYDILGFAGALQIQAGDTTNSQLVERLLESRENIDPVYSRLRAAGRATLVSLISQERRMGERSIVAGTTSDSYELRYAGNLGARTDVMAVGRGTSGNLLQVTWAVPGAMLKAIPNERGFVYPVRLRVSVADAQNTTVATLDTVKYFLSATEIPPKEHLVDRMSVPVPPGLMHYRIAVEQQEQRGIVMPTNTIEVGEFDGSHFTVSSLVLGWRNANLRWMPTQGDTVFFNPTGVYRRNARMELYYEVYGLPAGTPYQVELRVGKRDGGRTSITFKYEEHADSVVTRSHREVVLDRVRQGDYYMHLIITTADGRRVERQAAFQVSHDTETAASD